MLFLILQMVSTSNRKKVLGSNPGLCSLALYSLHVLPAHNCESGLVWLSLGFRSARIWTSRLYSATPMIN